MTRKEVYALIDGERDYQIELWAEYEAKNTVASFITYMRMYVNNALLPRANHEHVFRKVAALAVACMEQFGSMRRGGVNHFPPGAHREDVYLAIDEERTYQSGQMRGWAPSDDENIARADFLLLLDAYVRKAQNAWVKEWGDVPALHQVRKIAAIAVQCMEKTGSARS